MLDKKESSEKSETPRSELSSARSSQGFYGRQSTDVVLNYQCLSSSRHKLIQTCWGVLLVMSIAGNGAIIYFKTQFNASKYLSHPVIFQVNTAVGSCCVLALGAILLRFCWQIVRVTLDGCTWSRRQRYLVAIAFLQNVFQFINAVFFLVPNAYVLRANCAWFGSVVDACAYIQWFCWFTVFCLQGIHAHNMCPALDKEGSPDRDNPRLRRGGEPLKDPMVLDRPFWAPHWWKLTLWLVMEVSVITIASIGYKPSTDPTQIIQAPPSCTQHTFPGPAGVLWVVITIVWGAALNWFQSIIQWSLGQSSTKLAAQPYNMYMSANLMTLWQRRLTTWTQILGFLEIIYVLYSQWNHDVTYFLAWFGLMPLHILMAASVLANAYYFLPRNPSDEEHLLQYWRQDFAWTEADVCKKLDALHKRCPGLEFRLREEPIFCMATAIKLLLWSSLVYEETDPDSPVLGLKLGDPIPSTKGSELTDGGEEEALDLPGARSNNSSGEQEEAADRLVQVGEGPIEKSVQVSSTNCFPPVNMHIGDLSEGEIDGTDSGGDKGLDELKLDGDGLLESKHVAVKVDEELSSEEQMRLAMRMYKLSELEVFHEPITDTKVVIAWNDSIMVLSFRGTNSLANVLSDVKGWREPHPPQRGRFWLCSMPMVHHGFLGAWQKNDLNVRVLVQVNKVLQAAKVPLSQFRIYLTGHSLGGALATLAAPDIQKEHHLPQLQVYTFGAPRTGNHAWAQEAEQDCPHTWHVILDGDAVPRAFKFLWLYKRAGNRVLLNQMGDVRVRPTVWELCLHKHGFTISQHMLSAYLVALGSLCIAQLVKFKGVDGGSKGVAALAKSPEICTLLASAGVDLQHLLKHLPTDLKIDPRKLRKQAKKESGVIGRLMCKRLQPSLVSLARALPFSERLEASLVLQQGQDKLKHTHSLRLRERIDHLVD